LSRLDPKKGLDLLLLAFSQLDRPRPALVIAGSGSPDFEATLRRDAARLGLEGDIYWAGFLDAQEKLAALAEADVFVLPSYSENFGIAVVEAMACGVPVVISDRIGIGGQAAAAGAAIVVPCESEALVGAIRQFVEDEHLRRTVGECGRRLARERFSIEAMVAGLSEMYRDVLRTRTQPRPSAGSRCAPRVAH
jgi:glycosyltransferase involved in cell wall biosynthesis